MARNETAELSKSAAAALLSDLERTAALPLDQARATPPGLYRSADILALEMERIFASGWLCPGRTADIPNPGDYITFTIGDQPVMIVRGADGAIRAHANVCLHRMMRLVEGQGNCKRIVCPYHAWTYDIDGRLIGAPHMDRSAGFDKSAMKLAGIRCEVWQGWIYVTLDAGAPSVATSLEALGAVTGRYRQEHYIPVATEDYVWDTNWKLLTENFMEGYHLPVAHKATVGAWFPAEETKFPERVHDHFTWQTFTKRDDATYGLAHKDNKHLDGVWRHTSVMPTVFPSHMYVLAPDHLWYLSLRPRGVAEVDVRFGFALAPERHAAVPAAERKAFVAEAVTFFDKVNAEDKFVVRGIFEGAIAPLSRPGPLSWLEREIHDFQGFLARKLCSRA